MPLGTKVNLGPGDVVLDGVAASDHIDYMISRYQSRIRRVYDIVAAIYRKISCMNACLARALLTYRSGGVCI